MWVCDGLGCGWKDLSPVAPKKNAKFADVFVTNNPNLNWLSLARLFLFASRDFWFEVPLPFFLRSPSCDGLGVAACGGERTDAPAVLGVGTTAAPLRLEVSLNGFAIDTTRAVASPPL